MNISIDHAIRSLTDANSSPPVSGWPSGAPVRDFQRSPVAARIGRLAAAEGAFCFHFEHRAHLDLPDSWIEAGREDAAAPQTWTNGLLAERKYQSFRHDLMIGSFHPGHRGKWTAHELCHTLVGFAWRPDATPLFHATAARLAELLPVVVYYFFDEVRLARCPAHDRGGALYRAFCADCESLAAPRPVDGEVDSKLLAEGLRFIDREMAAIARSRREGLALPHRHGNLELASDGLAYARSHAKRLDSPAFRDWVALFGSSADGLSHTLDDLEARSVQVLRALLLDAPCPPRADRDPQRWTRQDLAMRLLQVREDTDGTAAESLSQLAEDVAAGAPLGSLRGRYDELAEEYVLPSVETMWAVGYPIAEETGRDALQIGDGLRSAAPLTMELLSATRVDVLPAFCRADVPERQRIGARFAKWLSAHHPGRAAELAAFEFAVQTAGSDEQAISLGKNGDGLRLASGFTVLACTHDVVAMAERVGAAEAMDGYTADSLLGTAGGPMPSGFVIGRDAAGQLLIIGVDHATAVALRDGKIDANSDADLASLRQLGALVPTRWPLTS